MIDVKFVETFDGDRLGNSAVPFTSAKSRTREAADWRRAEFHGSDGQAVDSFFVDFNFQNARRASDHC